MGYWVLLVQGKLRLRGISLNKYVSVPRGSIFIGDLDIQDIDYRILRKLIA